MATCAFNVPPSDLAELTFLRQFLRASINDRLAGDEVAAQLAARLPPPQSESGDVIERSRCYLQACLQEWRKLNAAAARAQAFDPRRVLGVQSLAETVAIDVALLCDVFGFSTSAAAETLGITRSVAAGYHQRERARRSSGVTGAALVVEDDPIQALSTRGVLTELGVADVVLSTTAVDALAAARAQRPDIVVSDYDLGSGGTGAQAVSAILLEMDCPVVFVTAFPDRVLTGSDFEPTFVIEKPVSDDTLQAAVFYALTRRGFSVIDGEASDDEDEPRRASGRTSSIAGDDR